MRLRTKWFAPLCALFGLCLFGRGLYMGAKAQIAQALLEQAWSETLETGQPTTLWGSMDARPLARFTVPNLGESAIILDAMSGQSLAFAPSHDPQSAYPGQLGLSLIAAHKNTHFAFLEDLKVGDEVHVQTYDNNVHVFRVTTAEIVHKDTSGITQSDLTDISQSRLALVTCYPFDQITFGGPLRYIVYAEKVEKETPAMTLTASLLKGHSQ